MRLSRTVSLLSVASAAAACGGSPNTTGMASGSGGGSTRASGASTSAAVGSSTASSSSSSSTGSGDMGSGSIMGMYGSQQINPIVAAYWVGKPGNPAESGGGPFIYLFSTPVTCAELSQQSGWVTSITPGTQVLELIVGTTSTGTPVQAAAHAAPGALEANYAIAPSSTESRAPSGNVTLTAYVPGSSVDGMVNVTFPSGSAQGTFHAVYCADGHEF